MSNKKRRSPKQPSSIFIEKLDGLHPLDFLAVIARSEQVEIDGVKYKPTSAQRRQAAASLAAALTGGDTQAEDSINPPEEETP